MFKFMKDIKELKYKAKKSDENIEKLKEKSKKNDNHINKINLDTTKHFRKQDMKIDELLETLIELQDINELQEENENLVESVVMMLNSVHMISDYLKNDNIDKLQLEKQLKILDNKINEQLIKSKITLISTKNQEFTPKKHEVINVFKAIDNSVKHGEIKNTIESGYMYKGKVIKKAKVEAYSVD